MIYEQPWRDVAVCGDPNQTSSGEGFIIENYNTALAVLESTGSLPCMGLIPCPPCCAINAGLIRARLPRQRARQEINLKLFEDLLAAGSRLPRFLRAHWTRGRRRAILGMVISPRSIWGMTRAGADGANVTTFPEVNARL
jgi:hypothetical protein